MVRYAVECRSAYSGRKPHGRTHTLILSFFLANSLANSLYSRQQKTRHIAVTGFFNLEPGNVLLSHGRTHTIIGAVSFHY